MNAIPGGPSLLPPPPSNPPAPSLPVTSMGTSEGPLDGQKPEPRVLGGREITDQRGRTRIVGPFYCSVCHKQFPHKSLTEIHLQCHMEKRLPCPFCDKMFKNKYVLKYHVEGAHNQTVGEPSPQLRRKLEKRSLNTVTCFCGISFETMNSYNEHTRTHQHHAAGHVQNEQRVNYHPCPMCKESFINLYQLVKHMEVHNNNNNNNSNHNNNNNSIHNNNNNRSSSSSPEVPVKRIVLSGGATLQLTPAPQTSDSLSTPRHLQLRTQLLLRHQQQQQQQQLQQQLNHQQSIPHEQQQPISLVSSRLPETLRAESSPPRPDSPPCRVAPKIVWECELCEDTFVHLALLRGHMHNKHHLYLVCLECHVFLSDVGSMAQHMSNVHPDVSAYPCSVCGRCFSDEDAAKSHLDAHKNGLADFSGCFQCSFCEALYDGERECALHEDAHRADGSAILS